MILSDYDIIDTEDTSICNHDLKSIQRQNYVAKTVAIPDDFDNDINGRKAKADFYYYRKQFKEAIKIYDNLLGDKGLKGATMRRDISESKSRSHLELGEIEQALNMANLILTKSPDHDDFRIVAYALKIDILTARWKQNNNTESDKRELMICLMSVLNMHPNLSRYWILLAKQYLDKSPDDAMCCLLLAKQFGSHIIDLNIDGLLEKLKTDYPQVDIVSKRVDFDYVKESSKDDNQEFMDLGRSTRLKEIEEKLTNTGHLNHKYEDCDKFMQDFEKNWFCRFS